MREHLDGPLTVEDMAEQAGMSSRHSTRAFIAETGTTPSKAVERLRIEVARHQDIPRKLRGHSDSGPVCQLRDAGGIQDFEIRLEWHNRFADEVIECRGGSS